MKPGRPVASATNMTAASGTRYPAPRNAAAPTTVNRVVSSELHRSADDAAGERARDDERDEEAADSTAGDGRRGRDTSEHKDRGDDPQSAGRVERPADGVVAGTGREILSAGEAGEAEDRGEARAGGGNTHPDPDVGRDELRVAKHPREDAGADPGDDAERGGGGEVLEGEGRGPGHGEECCRCRGSRRRSGSRSRTRRAREGACGVRGRLDTGPRVRTPHRLRAP